jgi:hypothetical protein
VVYDQRRALADSTRVDAREATWTAAGNIPVRIGAGRGVCFAAGTITGEFPDTTSWGAMHDTYAMIVYGPGAVVEGVRIHNYGDGVSFSRGAADWTLRGAHLSFIRDDCVQNDFLHAGTIEDVLFDGCYVGYSARTQRSLRDSVPSGRERVVTVRNTLWRLQPMPTVYSGPAPAHLGFFKLDPRGWSPRLALHDNLFFPAMPVRGSTLLWPPPEMLAGCSNNVLVWLGPDDPVLPPDIPADCLRVVRDRQVWDDAVAAWHERHGR